MEQICRGRIAVENLRDTYGEISRKNPVCVDFSATDLLVDPTLRDKDN